MLWTIVGILLVVVLAPIALAMIAALVGVVVISPTLWFWRLFERDEQRVILALAALLAVWAACDAIR